MHELSSLLHRLKEDFDNHKIEVADVFNQLFSKIDIVANNHIAHVQDGITSLNISQSSLKTDVDWLKKSFWAVFTASIGAFLSALVGLLLLLFK